MTTAIDTNVVLALWDKDATLSLAAQNALDAAFSHGTLVAAAPVFAELIVAPGRSEKFVGSFFEETGIGVDWDLSEQIWRLAGRAFQGYAQRRRKQRAKGTHRILRDFIIGAHALANGFRLLTSTKAFIGQPSQALPLRPSKTDSCAPQEAVVPHQYVAQS